MSKNTNNKIDVDIAIQHYNDNVRKPNEPLMTRTILAEKTNINKPIYFYRWRSISSPKVIDSIIAISRVTGCKMEKFLVKK